MLDATGGCCDLLMGALATLICAMLVAATFFLLGCLGMWRLAGCKPVTTVEAVDSVSGNTQQLSDRDVRNCDSGGFVWPC